MIRGWDTTVALAYAAEELVFAVQALTADLLPADSGLGVAHRHLHDLLQHEHFLPAEISNRLRNLDALYTECENSPAEAPNSRPGATRTTIAVLSDVRDLLQDQG